MLIKEEKVKLKVDLIITRSGFKFESLIPLTYNLTF